MKYEEKSIIIVPEFINIMVAGGIFKTEEIMRGEMQKRDFQGDIRFFKIQIVQDFLKKLLEFHVAAGLIIKC